jgi:uncharacterized protein (TIGR02452 family)
MSKRDTRAATAAETLEILQRGWYLDHEQQRHCLGAAQAEAQEASIHYLPNHTPSRRNLSSFATTFEVHNETTLSAARRLVSENQRVLALNFASAKNQGGGFLNGAQAQEESLARSSGLYPCLLRHRAMYDFNRSLRTCLYSDHMIYSPNVPVFRDDADRLIPFYLLSFLTAPAVNTGVVRKQERQNAHRVADVMLARIDKLLAIALHHGYEVLVLGAWGCGVFGNDPEEMADWFAQELLGKYQGAFRRVVFAVLDRASDDSTIEPFRRIFTTQ